MARIIIDGPAEFSTEVLAHLLAISKRLDGCEPGYGWREYGPTWTAFMRATKGGYSAKVSHRATVLRQPPNDGEPG